MPKILPLIHGSKEGVDKLIALCGEAAPALSKAALKRLVLEHATKGRGKGPDDGIAFTGTARWQVHEETWNSYLQDTQVRGQ